jgi:hypothetical protein
MFSNKNHGIKRTDQGQGKFTKDKEYGFDRVIAQWLSIVNHILPKHQKWAKPYIIYVDMNAGSGHNDEADCEGSPITYLEAWDRLNANQPGIYLQHKAFFIEKNAQSANKLIERLGTRYCMRHYPPDQLECLGEGYHSRAFPPCLHVCESDSPTILKDIVDKGGDKAFGLVYFDPNGIKMNSDATVFDVARSICLNPKFRYIDILIRFSGTNYKRIRKAFPDKYPDLRTQLKTVNKKKWICRKISYDEHGYRDPFQWTFLLGTNWTDYKAWKKEGFYDIDDPESNFQIINRTLDEV